MREIVFYTKRPLKSAKHEVVKTYSRTYSYFAGKPSYKYIFIVVFFLSKYSVWKPDGISYSRAFVVSSKSAG